MTLTKGMRIRETKSNPRPEFANTTANSTLVWEVTRVNLKTYSLRCVEGFWAGKECKLVKDFEEVSTDIYGTTTTKSIES